MLSDYKNVDKERSLKLRDNMVKGCLLGEKVALEKREKATI
jgi:hypothetical protein